MRGRKPKPVELRVLHGAAAERAQAEHPKPRRVLPRCPEHLTGEAAACWKRLSRELYDAGLLTTVDRDALAAYCDAYARWVRAKAICDGKEILPTKDGSGYYQNPYLSIANKAMEQMIKLAAEFGMTPSSRSRVKAEQAAAKQPQRPERERPQAATPAPRDDPRRLLV